MRHAAGAAEGGMGASAAHPTTVDRIPRRETAHARRRLPACQRVPGVKGGKATQGDAKRARRPKIWATATPGREPNLLPSRLLNSINACMRPIFALAFGKLGYFDRLFVGFFTHKSVGNRISGVVQNP